MEKEVVNNTSTSTTPPQSTDFVLQWGNRKRLRCIKTQSKTETITVAQTTVRVARRSVGSNSGSNGNHSINGKFNLRQRLGSPAQLPARSLRNTEGASGMKGHNNHSNVNNNNNSSNQNNGGVKGVTTPERTERSSGGKAVSPDTRNGSSSGGGDVWPPKFMIALTNKEKEEDFMAIKGSKLPQRPKKRAKFIQRSLNLVSPGGWLCDLTLERYEVREKKTSKKRPRGLKAMGSYMESDSE